MKKSLLKISVLCAACSMLAASAGAQTASDKPMTDQNSPSGNMSSDQNNRSWSTKHLSATGRNTDNAVRASRLVGAQVNDSNGQRAGQIQDIIVNPVSGRVDFALLSLGANGAAQASTYRNDATTTPNSTGKLIPVPWSLLRTSASAQYSTTTEQPMFTLNVDQSKLSSAPAVDWSNLSQSEWRQRIYSYYGVTPQPSMGGAESPEGEIKGEGAWKLQQGQQTQPQQAQPEQTPQPQ